MRYLLLPILILCCLSAPAQDSTYVYEYKIAETTIKVEEQCFSPCKSNIIFVHLHDNEYTSLEVANEYLSANGGRLVRLRNNNERIVETVLGNTSYCFDPNRIYSNEGIDASVLNWTDTTHPIVVEDIGTFSRQFLTRFINTKSLIVSLHNNTDTNYSIFQVQNDLLDNKYSGKIHVNPDMDQDDFILTNDTTIYNRIAAKNINVIWEDASAIEDDGSLSVYAGLHKIPYINVEAQHDHKEEQLALMAALKEIIEEYR